MSEFTYTAKFATPPKPVGYWVMPGSIAAWQTKFMAYERPNWLHRTCMRVLMGWEWRDEA